MGGGKIEKTLRQHVKSVPEDVTNKVREKLDGMVVEKEADTSTPEKVTAELNDKMSELSQGAGSDKLEEYVEEKRQQQIQNLANEQENLHKQMGEKESFECE